MKNRLLCDYDCSRLCSGTHWLILTWPLLGDEHPGFGCSIFIESVWPIQLAGAGIDRYASGLAGSIRRRRIDGPGFSHMTMV